MKTLKFAFLICSMLVVTTIVAQGQPKYLLASKTAPAEITLAEWTSCTELKTNDPAIVIKSFTIKFVLYGRDMEIVSTTGEITEEMYEGVELLKMRGEDPREFFIDNVKATKNGKEIKLPQHKIRVK